jgi:hypothetical protein
VSKGVMAKAGTRQGWIEKVVSTLLSYRESTEPVGPPVEMIGDAARKAFKISTALGLIPGPLGVAAILPEVAALTRLQVNLIYRIAKYHGRDETADSTIVLPTPLPHPLDPIFCPVPRT